MLKACQRCPCFSGSGILLLCHAAYVLCKLLTTWLSSVQQWHSVCWLKDLQINILDSFRQDRSPLMHHKYALKTTRMTSTVLTLILPYGDSLHVIRAMCLNPRQRCSLSACAARIKPKVPGFVSSVAQNRTGYLGLQGLAGIQEQGQSSG